MPPERLQTKSVGPVVTVCLPPEFGQPTETLLAQLRDQLDELTEAAEVPLLALDLAALSSSHPKLVALLVQTQRRLEKKGGRLVLVSPQEGFRNILTVTRLDKVLETTDDLPTAVRALQSPPASPDEAASSHPNSP